MRRRVLLGLAPLVLYLGALTLAPVVSTLVLSLRHPEGGWGLGAFRAIAGHYQFAEAVVNTLAITGISLALEFCLGLVAALSLAGRFRAQGVVRVLLLLPLGVPTIVAAAAMRYVFGTVGYLNELLYRLGLLSLPIDWTGSRGLALLTVAVADAWKVTPLVMLILLAGLQAIPREVYEAARTDGAGPWQQFVWITLPLLRPALTLALIVRGVDAFRIFALPLALVGRNLPVLSTYAYVEYLEYGNPYTAAASSTILLLLILFTVGAYLRLAGPEEVLR
ncbi:MAG: sugar ABC transporter permease [Candidatus Tectimicrobiota bacterium]|nr:MAG: sugar ABC transporter permease [Candidatus Tectomicrobia bacterium]